MPNLHSRDFITGCFTTQRIHGPVLEVGSGRDRFNRELFSKRYKVTATNIYPKNVVDEICSVTSLPFKQAQFGCVICEHVLEHVEEPARAIEEMYRVLKPGGLLILVVPFSWPLHEKPYDLWRFSEEGVRALIMGRFKGAQFTAIGDPQKPVLICAVARKPAQVKILSPKISVIMPTYNRAGVIGRAIRSVLGQTFKDWELIIVSDGSVDNTSGAVARYKDPRIRFFQKKNGGPSVARNYGLRRARGEYIAYCDDDDMLLPYHLQTLVQYLDRHPEIGLARGEAVMFDYGSSRGNLKSSMLWSVAHRRAQLKKVGLFDESFRMCEDIEFILRYRDYYAEKSLAIVLYKYVLQEKSSIVVLSGRIREFCDRLSTKRIRLILSKGNIRKEYYPLIARYLMTLDAKKAMLELSRIFFRRYDCIESAYLLGWAYYRLEEFSKAAFYLKKALHYRRVESRRPVRPGGKLHEFTYAFLSWVLTEKLNKADEAVCYLLQGLKKYPESALLRIEAMHGYRAMGFDEKASSVAAHVRGPLFGAYSAGVEQLQLGNRALASAHFCGSLRMDAILRYRVYDSLAKLARQGGRAKIASGYRFKAGTSADFTWGYPLFTNSGLQNIDIDELWKVAGKIFLLAPNPQFRIL